MKNTNDSSVLEKNEISEQWEQFCTTFFSAAELPTSSLQAIFSPLKKVSSTQTLVVGQLGQTMDGRIATITGQSRSVNGPAGLVHLHQLRSLLDAVVIGVNTALVDDPQLNVRLVPGKDPARVVIDPRARLKEDCRVWNADGVKKIWIVAQDYEVTPPPGVKVLALPAVDGQIAPRTILQGLHAQGLNRILIEGGAETVSRFMQAQCLDRLHLIVAPIIMGSGRPSFNMPAIEHMNEAVRLCVNTHLLGNEILFDCDFSK